MKFYRAFLYWLPAIVWGLVIFSFSAHKAFTVSPVQPIDFIVKKIAHFSEYFILSFLIYRALFFTSKIRGKSLLLMVLLVTVLYAITDEFHQSFTPGREPRIRDVLIDAGGSTVSLWLVTDLMRRHQLHLR